jgi:hypothetical protein
VHLRDVYWAEEGQLSIDAIILTLAILSLTFIISEAYDHHWLKKLRRR